MRCGGYLNLNLNRFLALWVEDGCAQVFSQVCVQTFFSMAALQSAPELWAISMMACSVSEMILNSISRWARRGGRLVHPISWGNTPSTRLTGSSGCLDGLTFHSAIFLYRSFADELGSSGTMTLFPEPLCTL